VADIPANTTSQARFEGIGSIVGSFTGTLDSEGDVDFIAIRLERSVNYDFFAHLDGAGAQDPVISIYAPWSEDPIASNDDALGSFDSFLSFSPMGTNTYYIAIRSAGSELAEYNLSFSSQSATEKGLTSGGRRLHRRRE
jgi:hypothetical protein